MLYGVMKLFLLLVMGVLSFSSFGEEEKVLDLGAIEIKGEVRRPNINLVHSKKNFDKFVGVVAKDELKDFERELLKPARLNQRPKRLQKRK